MGVPLVSKAGQDHRLRTGADLLTCLGLEPRVVGSACECIEVAIGLASNPAQLVALRTGLRRRMTSPLLKDGDTITRELGNTLMQRREKRSGQEKNT